jgi:hypothetical protein
MLTASELDDTGNGRIRAYLEPFRRAPVPDPPAGRWDTWKALLADRGYPAEAGARAAMNLDFGQDFGTVSSSLIALPAHSGVCAAPLWLHADGPPDRVPFLPQRISHP